MNSVALIGRLTRHPELKYTAGTQMAVVTFSIAVDRPVKAGGERQTDFPRVIVFGKQAENCDNYLEKGRLVGIHGRIQTGSYKRQDGSTAYTTDVVADRVEFLDWGKRESSSTPPSQSAPAQEEYYPPGGFAAVEEDIPF